MKNRISLSIIIALTVMIASIGAVFIPSVIALFNPFFAYESNYSLLFIVAPIVFFIVVGNVLEDEQFHLPCPEWLPFIIMIVLIVLNGWSYYHLTSTPRQLATSMKEAINDQAQPLLARLRSASNFIYRPGERTPMRPSMLTVCDLTKGDVPDLTTIKLAETWWVTLLEQLGRSPSEVRNFPSVEFESITVFAQGYRKTGRMVELDVGSVPEFRHYARIFIFDPKSLNCIYRGNVIVGPPAEPPGLRPGTHYYSAVWGKATEPFVPDAAFRVYDPDTVKEIKESQIDERRKNMSEDMVSEDISAFEKIKKKINELKKSDKKQ